MSSSYNREDEQRLAGELAASRVLNTAGLSTDDREWLRGHVELSGVTSLADGRKPPPDTSWIEMEEIGHNAWPFILVMVLIFASAVAYCWWATP
jgi:hypothetical protein